MVPVAMEELDEAHAALGQPARQQAVAANVPGLLRVGAVQLERAAPAPSKDPSAPAPSVCIRNAISYCAMRVAISGSPNSSSVAVVQLRRAHPGTRAASPRRTLRVREVQHRIADRAELHALVALGRKPLPHSRSYSGCRRRPRPAKSSPRTPADPRVSQPSPYDTHEPMLGRPAEPDAGLHQRHRRIVIDRLRVHRFDEREIVGDLRRVRQQLADPCARIARAART